MTQARIQPCCTAIIVKIGFDIGKENYPSRFTERKEAFYLYEDH